MWPGNSTGTAGVVVDILPTPTCPLPTPSLSISSSRPQDSMDMHEPDHDDSSVDSVFLKMLVSDAIAGAVIGKSGGNISGIMKASNAKLSVSSNGEYFPLTQYRVILIKGNVEAINIAQSTLWRIIASANTAKGADETNISGHLLIPEAASGLIIGRAGATIKRIATEAGVQCGLDSKDEVLVGERIMSISGPLDGCIAAVSMVLEKFADDPIASTYVNKTAKYTTASGIFHFGNNGKQPADHSSGQGYSVVSAETTIVMQVADSLIGSILGVKGAVLRELEAISGATISVSSRTELTEESKDRTVTITGEPTKAQAAFILVTQKFNQTLKTR